MGSVGYSFPGASDLLNVDERTRRPCYRTGLMPVLSAPISPQIYPVTLAVVAVLRISTSGPQTWRPCQTGESITMSSKGRTWIGFCSAGPGIALLFSVTVGLLLFAPPAFAAGGNCPTGANYINPSNPTGPLVTLSSLGITSCFYASKSLGSDSNAGTSEASGHPWAHLPGMPSCTGTCASITPAAGEGFILYGGDTWVSSDLDLYWQGWSGTSIAPIYIGVDLTWYNSSVCGASWCRPILNCSSGNSCSYTANGGGYYTDQSGVQYVTLDNIEMTGLYESTAGYPAYVSSYGNYNTFERLYLHGWSHASAGSGAQDNSVAISTANCCGGGLNESVMFNVIDGSDTTEDMLQCFSGSPTTLAYNVCQYETNGLQGTIYSVHDNFFGPIGYCFVTGGCHQNALSIFSNANSLPTELVYNNVITGLPSGGMVKLWLNQFASTGATLYAFNNVIFNNAPGNYINLGGHGAVNNGTWYFFNNTVECGTDSDLPTGAGGCGNDNGGTSGETFTLYEGNNHFIKGDTTAAFSCTYGTCASILNADVVQTLTTANGQGYNDTTETHAFSPANASGSTVGAGANAQSICTTIAGLNAAAGAACQDDTGYACSYNMSNHTVSCPDRTANARPPSGAWDIGAYQYGDPPNPPTGLTAVVQ